MNSSDWISVLVIGATIAGLILWPRGSFRERAQGWVPLAAIINGRIRGNGVTGTYNGVRVRAAILGCGETGGAYRLDIETDRRRWNWSIGYYGDKLLGGPGDKLVGTGVFGPHVFAQAFITREGQRKVLLVNKRNRLFQVSLSGASGENAEHVDQTTAFPPPASRKLTGEQLPLSGFAVAVVTLPED